jgi:hypothetical protein
VIDTVVVFRVCGEGSAGEYSHSSMAYVVLGAAPLSVAEIVSVTPAEIVLWVLEYVKTGFRGAGVGAGVPMNERDTDGDTLFSEVATTQEM